MLLATARGNEVAYDSYLSEILRNLEDSGMGNITEIQVGNLQKRALGEMLSDLLGVPPDDCKSLTEIVYQRSNQGHVFHAVRYVESLQEEGYLIQDDNSGIWSWNEKMISNEPSDDFLTNDSLAILLGQKTKQMPKKTQEILKVASCLGGEFFLDILYKAANMSAQEGTEAFKIGRELGFVTFKSETDQIGRFVHDKFQEAAYALIPESKKPAFHLQVGRNLAANLPPDEFEENLLLIVNLGIFGSEVIDVEECRQKLAELCLSAGRRAAKSSAFSTAVHYLETGIKMLASSHWQNQYSLSLELHTAAAEMAYCMGAHKKVDTLADAIYGHAQDFNDQLPAKSTQLMSWFSSERYEDAVQLGFGVSKDLGEKFPRKPGTLGILVDFMKTRRMLSGKRNSDILSLPLMTNTRVAGVMSIIHILYGLLMRTHFELAPLIGFRMVRLTMKYGLSPMSELFSGA
jgi:predicted ATPase